MIDWIKKLFEPRWKRYACNQHPCTCTLCDHFVDEEA